MAVGYDSFVGKNVGEFSGDRIVGCVAATGQQPAIVEYGRRGADRGQPAPGGVLPQHALADAFVGAEEFGPSAAGQEDQVVVAVHRFEERSIGLNHDIAAPSGMAMGGERGGRDRNAGPTQQINGSECLDFFETIGEGDKHRGHRNESSHEWALINRNLPSSVILSGAKDPSRRLSHPSTWILRCAQDDGAGS